MSSISDLDIIKKTDAKLREVTLTYKFSPTAFGRKAFIQNATLSLVGRNLLYFFPQRYKDLDVDQYSQGVYSTNSNGTYTTTPSSSSGLQTPTTRSYGLNFNFSF
jgi:hypothetical protein